MGNDEKNANKSKEDLYTVQCRVNPDTTYKWHREIDRAEDSNKNNIAYGRFSPQLMAKIQEKFPNATSGRRLISELCESVGIDVTEDDLWIKPEPRKAAASDDTDKKAQKYVEKFEEALKKAEKAGKYPNAEQVEKKIDALNVDDDIKDALKERFIASDDKEEDDDEVGDISFE